MKIETKNLVNRVGELFHQSLPSQQRPYALNRQSGISLLEVLIVAGVITVLGAIAIPQVSRTLELQRLDSAAARVASKLMDARMNAIKRNAAGKLSIVSTRTMQVNCPGTTPVGALETLPSGISFSASTPASITFDSLGRLTTGAQTATLQSTSGRAKALTISPAGKITVGSMY